MILFKFNKISVLGLTFILLLLLFSCIVSKHETIPITNKVFSKNWINIKYLKCIESKLPCECEASSKEPYVIILDTNINSKFFGIQSMMSSDTEFFEWDIKKENSNKYSVINNTDYSSEILGSIVLKNDTLFYYNENKTVSVFINYGKSQKDNSINSLMFDQRQLEIANILLLNKAFINHGYPTLENIFNSDSLSCYCNKELGGMNIILGNNKVWVIEQRKDSLLIYNFIDHDSDKTYPRIFTKTVFKTYKGDKP